MFFVFRFLHFLCKFGIPREQCDKKNSEKVEKNDILEKKIPMWRSTDRQALFWTDLTVGVLKKGPSLIWQHFEKFRPPK